MRKFIKTLLVAIGMLFITSTTIPNATDDTLYNLALLDTPEALYTMSYFGVSVFSRENIKQYPSIFPIHPQDASRISSFFGPREHPIYNKEHIHTGVDIAAPKGTPVLATGDGTVEGIRKVGAYGKQIVLWHSDEYSTRYAHLSKILVKKGDVVSQGDTIGEVGSTGLSTGNHLHYEISHQLKTMDPLSIYPDTIQEENYLSYLQSVNDHYLSCFSPNV